MSSRSIVGRVTSKDGRDEFAMIFKNRKYEAKLGFLGPTYASQFVGGNTQSATDARYIFKESWVHESSEERAMYEDVHHSLPHGAFGVVQLAWASKRNNNDIVQVKGVTTWEFNTRETRGSRALEPRVLQRLLLTPWGEELHRAQGPYELARAVMHAVVGV